MSQGYQAVLWNRQKRRYDTFLALGIALFLAGFIGVSKAIHPHATAETILIRSLGACAIVLLHVVLSIGPLTRLDRRWLPLLYNRRHLGVTLALVASAHGMLSLVQFHALGNLNPLVSLWVSNGRWTDAAAFPFQPLGFVALVILILMAATSHDFWLAQLSAPVWKRLHMGVYLAYGLVVSHVALGAALAQKNPLLWILLAVGATFLTVLHLLAAGREKKVDRESPGDEEWVGAGSYDDIEDGCARVVTVAGERVAIFRNARTLSAISNVCQHQNGPLGEGRIIDGCITCPWHGYQYDPATGASPPPFTEKVPTFRLRLRDRSVEVHSTPLAPGTRVEPLTLPDEEGAA